MNLLKGIDFKNKKMIPIFIGLAGILLLFLSSAFTKRGSTETSAAEDVATYSVSQYTEQLEKRLEKNICKMNGIKNCSVMITLKTTEKYIYATEEKRNTDMEKQQSEEKYVILDNRDGGDTALKEAVVLPQINGVLVMCDGVSDIAVKSDIIEAVTTVLDITSNRVCVLDIN